jgi:hypothetical protein
LSWLPKGEPRKWFVAAGSDAHGDFNYRQGGQVCENRWCVDSILDTAIGRPRNLVQMFNKPITNPTKEFPQAKRYANNQVIDALREGNFTATDGPALRIAIDKNRNGIIDDNDFPMGTTFNLYPGEQIPVVVEWLSTKEFGPLQKIDLYVGNKNTTYAPLKHGPYIPADPWVKQELTAALTDPDLGIYHQDYGSYTPDPSGSSVLNIDLNNSPATMRLHGRAAIFLSAPKFGIHSNAQNELFYIRAFARTRTSSDIGFLADCDHPEYVGQSCGNRIAYSNPVWGRKKPACPSTASVVATAPNSSQVQNKTAALTLNPFSEQWVILIDALDGDLNGTPDVCEKRIPDPCKVTSNKPGDIVTGSNVITTADSNNSTTGSNVTTTVSGIPTGIGSGVITTASENPVGSGNGSPIVVDSLLSCKTLYAF